MEFTPRTRNYESEFRPVRSEPCTNHPLVIPLPELSSAANKKLCTVNSNGIDPLGSTVSNDPLSFSSGITATILRNTTPDGSRKSSIAVTDPLGALGVPATGDDPLGASALTPRNDPLFAASASSTRSSASALAPVLLRGTRAPPAPRPGTDYIIHSSRALAEDWNARRAAVLLKYTTSERLSIVTNVLGDDLSVKLRDSGNTESKMRERLEELDTLNEPMRTETAQVTQQEFVQRIEEMSRQMAQAWHMEQRVKALKIVIQMTKLINDSVGAAAFYPSKFVLVTDILERFGRLVYRRLYDKCMNPYDESPAGGKRTSAGLAARPFSSGRETDGGYPAPESVNEVARETARNWFLKISVIRELLPRFFVEAALVASYRFLEPPEPKGRALEPNKSPPVSGILTALKRLVLMSRGIADPLICIHARLFLCRMMFILYEESVLTSRATHHQHLLQCLFWPHCPLLEDSVQLVAKVHESYRREQNLSSNVHMRLTMEKARMVGLDSYLNLFAPALDWLFHCIASLSGGLELRFSSDPPALSLDAASSAGAPELESQNLLRLAAFISAACKSPLLLWSALSAFRPELLVLNSVSLLPFIRAATAADLPQVNLYKLLGQSFAVCPDHVLESLADCALEQPAAANEAPLFKLALLNEVFHDLQHLASLDDVLQAVEVWTDPFARFALSPVSLERLLDVVVARSSAVGVRIADNFYQQILSMLHKLLTHLPVSDASSIGALLMSVSFGRFVDLLQKESLKLDAYKDIFENYLQRLVQLSSENERRPLSDPMLISLCLHYARALHDSITVTTLEDERRAIARLVCNFIQLVELADAEEQLNMYVQFRAAFANLDAVQVALVHLVNRLALTIHSRQEARAAAAGGQPDGAALQRLETRSRSRLLASKYSRFSRAPGASKKVLAFQHACAAFTYITIPALSSPVARLNMYLFCCQIDLITGCVQQAESCAEAAVELLRDLFCGDAENAPDAVEQSALSALLEEQSKHVSQMGLKGARGGKPASAAPGASGVGAVNWSEFLVEYVGALLSTLLMLPDNPQQKGSLQLLRKALALVQELRYASPAEALGVANGKQLEGVPSALSSAPNAGVMLVRFELYLHALELLSAMHQRDYLYRAPAVDNNALLYCGDPKFLVNIRKLCGVVVQELKQLADALVASSSSRPQLIPLLVRFLLITLAHADLAANGGIDILRAFGELLLINKSPGEMIGRHFHGMLSKQTAPDGTVAFVGLQRFASLDANTSRSLFQVLNKLAKS